MAVTRPRDRLGLPGSARGFGGAGIADAARFVGCLAFALILASVYVRFERSHYAYDYRGYHDLTRGMAEFLGSLSGGPLAATVAVLERVWTSTGRDYSDVPTLALAPFVLLWGDSRTVYALALVTVYLIPFALVVGYIAAKLIPSHPRPVFWLAAALTLLSPAAWIPTLKGYPDVGGAALIGLALALYLSDLRLQRRRTIVLIGVALALAILFRRHYLFAASAFLAILALDQTLASIRRGGGGRGGSVRALLRSALAPGAIVASMLLTLLLLGTPFIHRFLVTNYQALYAGWEVPWQEGLRYYVRFYGLATCLLVALGLGGGAIANLVDRRVALLLTLFGALSLVQWVWLPAQTGLHYTLHFTPVVVVGLTACARLGWTALESRRRPLLLAAASLYIAVNAAIGLGPPGPLVGTPLRALFSANGGPVVESDFDEVHRLVSYLGTRAAADEPIYIVGADPGHDVFRGAAASSPPRQGPLRILRGPDIDSSDTYPLEHLLVAQYVVVEYPPAPPASAQKVSQVVVDAFHEGWEIAHDFVMLPEAFFFDGGTRALVYERRRPTAVGTALRTFDAIRRYVGKRPGSQPAWMRLGSSPSHAALPTLWGRYDLVPVVGAGPADSATTFLYIEPTSGPTTVTGRLVYDAPNCEAAGCAMGECAGAWVDLALVDDLAQVRIRERIDLPSAADGAFRVRLDADAGSHLMVTVAQDDGGDAGSSRCGMSVRDVAVS